MAGASEAIVVVTGASGFIGKVVVATLADRGHRIRALTRDPARWPLPPRDGVEVVAADLRDAASLARAVAGASAVVHLAAAKSDEPDSEEVNVGGAERLVAACRAAGCTRLVVVSTQSVKIARQGTYARTKAAADAVFRASGLRVTTLLPSLVYGEEPSGVFGTVSRFVRALPVLPILGDGRWRSAPVYVGDVADAVAACLASDRSVGRSYDIGGPELMPFDEVVDRIADALGVRARKLHLPFGLSLLAARAAAALLPSAPITVSNVLGSNQDTAIDIGPARRELGFAPRDFASGLALALGGSARTPRAETLSLADEGRVFARYLLGVEPADELVERYAAAHRALLGDPGEGSAEVRFVHRHPGALPYLDAALGLFRRESELRQKLLVAAAVLEATPLHADIFLGRPRSPLRVLATLAGAGLASAAKLAVGVPLWLAVRRRR